MTPNAPRRLPIESTIAASECLAEAVEYLRRVFRLTDAEVAKTLRKAADCFEPSNNSTDGAHADPQGLLPSEQATSPKAACCGPRMAD